jgi:non-specific serine/threonine protein kinase
VRGGAPSGPGAPAWLAQLRRDLPNLRVALHTAAASDPEALAALVADLSWGWRWLGHLTEYGEWLDRALAPADPAVRLRLLDAAGMVAHDRDRFAEAAEHFEAAARLAHELGDRRAELTAQTRAAIQHVQLGRLDAGEARLREALAGARELGDQRVGARIVNNLAGIALIRRDFAAAMPLAAEAAATYAALGDEHLSAQALNNAALAAVHLGLYERAGRDFRRALEVFARLELGEYIAYALIGVAAAAVRTGDPPTAALLLGRAEALRVELEFHLQPFEQGVADEARALACAALGDARAARLLAEGAELTVAQARELAERPARGPATAVGRADQ